MGPFFRNSNLANIIMMLIHSTYAIGSYFIKKDEDLLLLVIIYYTNAFLHMVQLILIIMLLPAYSEAQKYFADAEEGTNSRDILDI